MADHVLQLDRLLRTSLTAFVADVTAQQWQGKERDCVNRFAIGYLVAACGKHHFLEHPTQIGIEKGGPAVSVARVADRVERSGHHPPSTVKVHAPY